MPATGHEHDPAPGGGPVPPAANEEFGQQILDALLPMDPETLEHYRPAIAGEELTDPDWNERAQRNGILTFNGEDL